MAVQTGASEPNEQAPKEVCHHLVNWGTSYDTIALFITMSASGSDSSCSPPAIPLAVTGGSGAGGVVALPLAASSV
ncbi:hypothetical protein PpBr36_05112 [Pyricularia pennisetigena]|uniref:hypothetical protein n=1 Tax=Pyricularia pennisetigena TaxID=1578925 RepID=UPI00114ECE08|nr:hypothetical protein PpBr36_05112 [Pyricularia pennisetigena]TLS26578.1 hypothetical protein PpBr36_05112 [Pyricularia pennisetigena]